MSSFRNFFHEEFTSSKQNAKFKEAKAKSKMMIRDIIFFEISMIWKFKNYGVVDLVGGREM